MYILRIEDKGNGFEGVTEVLCGDLETAEKRMEREMDDIQECMLHPEDFLLTIVKQC